jgi:hypothetical protein
MQVTLPVPAGQRGGQPRSTRWGLRSLLRHMLVQKAFPHRLWVR